LKTRKHSDIASYLSDLQARLARLERNPGEPSNATESQRFERDSDDHEGGRRESPDEQQQPHNRSTPSGTRESSPRSRQNPEDAELTNPMVESSKFMSSSTGRTCKLPVYTLSK
jgi:proline utilization trans-activator